MYRSLTVKSEIKTSPLFFFFVRIMEVGNSARQIRTSPSEILCSLLHHNQELVLSLLINKVYDSVGIFDKSLKKR